jgi:hypothetical protein
MWEGWSEGVNEGGRMGNFRGLELVEATVELIKEKEPIQLLIAFYSMRYIQF